VSLCCFHARSRIGNDPLLRPAERPHNVDVKDCCAGSVPEFPTGEDRRVDGAVVRGADGGIRRARIRPAFSPRNDSLVAGRLIDALGSVGTLG